MSPGSSALDVATLSAMLSQLQQALLAVVLSLHDFLCPETIRFPPSCQTQKGSGSRQAASPVIIVQSFQFSWSKFPEFDTIMIILLRVLYILTDLHVSSVHFGLPPGTHALFPPPVVRPLLRAGVGGTCISHLILRDIYFTSLNLLFHCLLTPVAEL